MTLAAEILALYDGERTTREIANALLCRPEYVRVVARQRRGSTSEIDERYLKSSKGIAYRAMKKEGVKAYNRAYYATKDKRAARAAYKRAMEAARA